MNRVLRKQYPLDFLKSSIFAIFCSMSATPAMAQMRLDPIDPVESYPSATLTEMGFSGNFSLRDLPESMNFSRNPRDLTLTHIGNVTAQGDFSPPTAPGGLRAAEARSLFGVDGTGIRIGVISDSYDFLGGAAAGILSGDLPGIGNPNGFMTPVTILDDDDASSSIDEGRAMLEIIHDLVPGAELLFHSAFNNIPVDGPGEASIATAIDNLVAAGAHIIVDDVAFLNQPFYQDGLAAQAVDNAFAQGVAYFSSAGNSGSNAYENTFNGVLDSFHDFDPLAGVDNFLDIAVGAGSSVRVTLEWDDPFPSLGTVGPISDFDLGLWDFDADDGMGGMGAFVSVSVGNQTMGDDPWELVGITNNTASTKTYGLVIDHAAGDINKLLKAIVFGGTIVDPNDTNSPTNFGHSAAEGGQAIAAIRYDQGGNVESFSSRGPTTILFEPDGTRLSTPEVRATPDLTATNGVNTTFFFTGVDYEGDGFPNFFGTSAAAPHAAAVAAMLLQRGQQLGVNLSPSDIYQILQSTARDIEEPGFDINSGHGVIDAVNAVGAVAAAPVPESSQILGLLLIGVFGVGRVINQKKNR